MSKVLVRLQKESTLVVFIFFLIIMSILSPNFLTTSNLFNVLRQASTNGLIAFGMTLVILTAGIDLSVGSILAFSSVSTALLIQADVPSGLVLILGLLIGFIIGLCNGIIIAYGNIQAFIATLSTMTIFRGLTLVISKGRPISIVDSSPLFENIGTGYFLRIPIPVIILFVIFVLLWIMLQKTIVGRYIYALGGNERASYIAGVKNNLIKLLVYGISGMLSAVAGFVLISRLSSAQPTLGTGFELDAIAAVVIGGTRLSGGKGRIIGTLIGALIIGVLNNSLNLLDVSSFYQQVVKGLVILFAVLLDLKKK